MAESITAGCLGQICFMKSKEGIVLFPWFSLLIPCAPSARCFCTKSITKVAVALSVGIVCCQSHTSVSYTAVANYSTKRSLCFFFGGFVLMTCIYLCHLCAPWSACEGQRTGCTSYFSPSTMWIRGIKLGSRGLVASHLDPRHPLTGP